VKVGPRRRQHAEDARVAREFRVLGRRVTARYYLDGIASGVAELREAATRSNDADATRRMLALALVLEGYKRGEAGKLCGMDRQTLRDWVLRYNAEGIAGLCNRIAAGPKPRLTPQQEAAVAELVRKGPDLAVDGVVRWRRVDLTRSASAKVCSPATCKMIGGCGPTLPSTSVCGMK